MTDKEFKHLKREDLIEIIYEYQKREQKLLKINHELEEQLKDRRIKIEKAGSIAEAVVGLSDIFAIAQETADRYLEEVKRISGNPEKLKGSKEEE